jgi:DNA-binding MarR family transcriptional regulator
MKAKRLQKNQAPDQLHAALKSYLGYCFYKAATKIRAMVDERLEDFRVVAPQFGMLIILQVHGSQTQAELGQQVGMDKASMVRMLDGLEGLGLVKRLQSQQDRRANHLQITTKGRQAIVKMDKVRRQAEELFLAPLSAAERSQLTNIVGKLLRG